MTEAQSLAKSRRNWGPVVDSVMHRVVRHWLSLVTVFWALYVGLPLAAPAFMAAGWTTPATLIYLLFRPTCHQLPERSFFIGGPKVVYSTTELEAAGVQVGPPSRDIGNAAVGWKVAICQRDVALYGTMFLGSLVYALFRRRVRGWHMRPLHYLVFVIPILLDGGLQLIGLYESTWVLRTVTGTWFAAGSVLFAYPYLDQALRAPAPA